MNYIILFSIIAITAYILQFGLGYFQIKHFNEVYSDLRRKGRVAIGTRAGKISAGTIVMFAIDDEAKILDARKMQGVSVIAKFKELPDYIGEDLHFIDHKHPLVQKENKLTKIAMEDARDLFIKVEMGDYTEEKKSGPVDNLLLNTKVATNQFVNKFKRSA
ncbi:transcriptional regulator [Suicoccus acidiformans]|uniref:Transcriptional regulator n=1 Tax=Suicoccus acidiformans TaxID=2036206 RepID=A0A347WIQ5_9LACT|nr:transcriptional regulator GutM [Suicoccus acidiformans]AXY24962.1 transcriptional regulator [Suicoccus acidiformans]